MADQDEIFAFMASPASHGADCGKVERIDTHAAVVFLAGDMAYKIKRAVSLDYLDFSTLEKRHAVCERELELNARTAPEIYLSVVAITRESDGQLKLDGKGEPVEWAVRMRRFDQENLFDRMAQSGNLPLDLMPCVAETVAEAHLRSRRVRGFDHFHTMEKIVGSILESLGKAADVVGKDKLRELDAAFHDHLARHGELLRDRARRGFIRRCHGDLHLRNIVLLDGEPTLFDAIEFDDDIATVDILYDLAFLLMDLWHRDLKGHANALFNSYMGLPVSGPPMTGLKGLALLPFYMAVRAGVRAMVACDRLDVVDGDGREETVSELLEFFTLARDLLNPPQPEMVAVGGLSGTGKSNLARGLAPYIGRAPGAIIVRSDVERKRLAGVPPDQRLEPHHYTAAATGQVYGMLCRKAGVCLIAGHGVVVDAVYARPVQRERVEQTARRHGASFTGIWLETNEGEMVDRVEARKGDASDADASVVRKQLNYSIGNITSSRVDASGKVPDVLVRACAVLGKTPGQ